MKLYCDLSAVVTSDLTKIFENKNGKCEMSELFQMFFLIVSNSTSVETFLKYSSFKYIFQIQWKWEFL